jgi:hypothetical protein
MSTQFTNRQWRLPNNENKDKQSNYSMDFERASASYIDLGTIDITGSCTISFWINFNSISHAYQKIFFAGTSASDQFSIGFATTNQGVAVNTIFASGQEAAAGTKSLSNNSISTNTWYNVVITKTTGVVQNMYLNGVDDTNTPTGFWWGGAPNVTRIGDSGNALDAKLDGVAIFDYVLSSSQVTTLYGSSSTGIGNPMSLSPKPVAYYPLGDQDAFNGASYLTPNSSLKDYVFSFAPNSYISIPDLSSLRVQNLTVSFWVNAGTQGSNYKYFLEKGSFSYVVYTSSTTTDLFFFMYDGSSYYFSNALTNVLDSNWHHITFTYNGSQIIGYKDGVANTPVSASVTLLHDTNPLTIGGRSPSPGSYPTGKISNAQIFNTALPATGSNSVETLYNNGSPLTSMSGFTSLQGWWKLDASATYDSSTTTWTIEDSSTNSNTGTSSGMTQANLVQSDLSFTSGYSPYALDFDGANDYINFTGLPDFGGGSLSISFWIKSGVDAFNAYVLNRALSFYIFQVGVTTNLRYRLQTSSLNSINGGPILDNNWHNCVMTFDSSANEFKVFEDGSQVGSTVTTSGSLASSTAVINFLWNGSGYYKGGGFSNLSMWNTALSSAQVTEIYSEGIPQNLNNHSAYSNLVSWWQLGSNSSYTNKWICLDEKGTNNGESVNMDEVDIVDGVGSYANGLSSGMGGDEVIGDAPYSSSNSLSVNMDVLDRVTDTPS